MILFQASRWLLPLGEEMAKREQRQSLMALEDRVTARVQGPLQDRVHISEARDPKQRSKKWTVG